MKQEKLPKVAFASQGEKRDGGRHAPSREWQEQRDGTTGHRRHRVLARSDPREAVGNPLITVRIDRGRDAREIFDAIDARSALFVIEMHPSPGLREAASETTDRVTLDEDADGKYVTQVAALDFRRRDWLPGRYRIGAPLSACGWLRSQKLLGGDEQRHVDSRPRRREGTVASTVTERAALRGTVGCIHPCVRVVTCGKPLDGKLSRT